MAISKVASSDGTVHMDITDSTVTADTLADGAVAYGADGERIVGKMTMGLPVGHEWITMNPNIPTGCLPLLGGTFSRTAYKDLWEWVQTQGSYLITEAEWQEKATANEGNVAFYSDGDGSTTFRVPSRSCWVKGANNTEEVGSYLEAGLPNITGTASAFRAMNGYAHEYTGALYDAGGESKSDQANTGAYSSSFGIDASLSSPVYGASDTVQPQSLVGMWVVQAFGTVSNAGNQDIADISAGFAEISADVTSVKDRVGAVESRVYLVESYRNGTEWYRVYSDGWTEQGGYIEGSGYNTQTITFLVPMADADYLPLNTSEQSGSVTSGYGGMSSPTTTSVVSFSHGNHHWYVCGMGAWNG